MNDDYFTRALHNTLVVCAFRYALGRQTQTYIVTHIASIISANWLQLTTASRELIQKEIREADNHQGGLGSIHCDRPQWLGLLQLDPFQEKEKK
jgi:hypothetical protein